MNKIVPAINIYFCVLQYETLSNRNKLQYCGYTILYYSSSLGWCDNERRGDSLQLSPRITYRKHVDTKSPWGGELGEGYNRPRLPDTQTVLLFPFLLSILFSSRPNKRPPRQREMILGDSWVSCFLIESPHFAELSGERKKKRKVNHHRRPSSPPGSCWVRNHRLMSAELHRCVAGPLRLLLQATSDCFWWAKGRIPGSRE